MDTTPPSRPRPRLASTPAKRPRLPPALSTIHIRRGPRLRQTLSSVLTPHSHSRLALPSRLVLPCLYILLSPAPSHPPLAPTLPTCRSPCLVQPRPAGPSCPAAHPVAPPPAVCAAARPPRPTSPTSAHCLFFFRLARRPSHPVLSSSILPITRIVSPLTTNRLSRPARRESRPVTPTSLNASERETTHLRHDENHQ